MAAPQTAADAAALVAELRTLSTAGGSYEEQTRCCTQLCHATPLLTGAGAAAVDAVRVIVAALSRGVQHAPLQLAGCVALRMLLQATPGLSATAGAAGVAGVLAALRTHPGDTQVLIEACGALAELTSQDASNRTTAVAAGGISVALAAMAQHPSNPRVLSMGCVALTFLAKEHARNAVAALDGGAATAAIAAMHAFKADVQLHLAGCSVLVSIVRASGRGFGGVHADGAAADAVVASMRAHAGDSRIQQQGCLTLQCLFEGRKHADAAWVRRGGEALTVVTAALRAHPQEVSVLIPGCAAITSLMMHSEASQRAAGTCGAIAAVVSALRAFPAEEELQKCGFNALNNMCYNVRDNQLAAAAAGGLEVAVATLRTQSDLEIQTAACGALGALIISTPSNQRRAGELGGVEAMLAALRACTASPRPDAPHADFFQCWGTTLLKLLMPPVNAHKAVAAGVIELLVGRIRCAPAAADAADFGWECYVLKYLLGGTEHEARAMLAGTLEALEALGASQAVQAPMFETACVELIQRLQPAARRHDAAPCAVAGCQRCAAARASGAMCALPGCGARGRDGAANKKLLRCGTCRAACYCGAAHQREDWGRHKGTCSAPARDDDRDAGASGS
jgi:hypothetical protein